MGFETPANTAERFLDHFEGVDSFRKPRYSPRVISEFTLSATLEPEDNKAFKRELLKVRKAIITRRYRDGTTKETSWNAFCFSENSNVTGNLVPNSDRVSGRKTELERDLSGLITPDLRVILCSETRGEFG